MTGECPRYGRRVQSAGSATVWTWARARGAERRLSDCMDVGKGAHTMVHVNKGRRESTWDEGMVGTRGEAQWWHR